MATPVPAAEPFSGDRCRARPIKHSSVTRGNVQSTPKGILKINSLFSFELFQSFFFQNDLAYYTKLSAKRFSLMTRLISHSSLLFQLEKLQVVSIPEMSEEWHETGMGFGKETFYETLV